MPTVSAILGNLKLNKLESVNNSRISNSLILKKILHPLKGWELPIINPNEKNIFTKFVVKVEEEKRNKIASELEKLGMEVSKSYDYVFKILKLLGKFPVSETLCKTLLTLPNYPNLSLLEIYRIGKSITEPTPKINPTKGSGESAKLAPRNAPIKAKNEKNNPAINPKKA